MNKVFIFPGQGSQYVGMCNDLFTEIKEVRDKYDQANEILGYDIADISFNGPENKLQSTIYTQPAIFMHSIIINDLLKKNGLSPNAVAGHSLGEITALVSANVLNFKDALLIIKIRAKAMHDAGLKKSGSMAAIIGGDDEQIKQLCSIDDTLTPANQNAPGQIIISGETNAIHQAIHQAKTIGIKRVMKLNVSGAFHSPLMKEARIPLKDVIESVNFKTSQIPIYQNFNAKPETQSKKIKENLIKQLENPVLWNQIINLMSKNNITNFFEIGPGKVLKGLNRRINNQILTYNYENLEDVNDHAVL